MRDNFKDQLHISNDSIPTTDTSPSSSPRAISNIHGKSSSISQENPSNIKEVYDYNFIEELNVISELLDEYNYIGMDTEFPGTVFTVRNFTNDFYYKTLKLNIDSLKLIQLGITITNENGEYPKNIPYHTWQFNFEFDINKDQYNEQSINLLKKSGINFEKLKKNGINKNKFAASLMTSGLVLNSDVYWISYHGSYDFGYLLSLLTNEDLPENEEEYIKILGVYFPNYYDVKMLVRDLYYLDGGLNKLINKLGVSRKGIMHQAGSDSIATIESFLALINTHIINDAKIIKFKNSLYGIGIGRDNEITINYTNNINSINNNNDFNMNSNNNNNNKINNLDEKNEKNKCAYNMKQSQIHNYINYSNYTDCNTNINNNNTNVKFNWYCPYVIMGNFNLMQSCNNGYMNNTNNSNNYQIPCVNEIMA